LETLENPFPPAPPYIYCKNINNFSVASEAQLEMARQTVEQAVMGRVYLQALYPNGEGDISRDL
jgi:hypothetical protein